MKSLVEKLTRALLLLRCLLVAFFLGRANKPPVSPKLVMVVLTGKLGDVVCGTPVLSALRTHFPQTRIIIAGDTKYQKGILEDSGLVDGYLDLSNSPLDKIKEYAANAAFVTGPSFKPTALMYLAGIPLVVAPDVKGGFSPAETRLYKTLKKLITTFPYEIYGYAPRERLGALGPIGIVTDDTTKHLGFSTKGSERAENFLKEKGLKLGRDFVVGISVTAGNKIKEWPTDRFARVADHLVKKHQAKILLLGGPGDAHYVESVIKQAELGAEFINAQKELFDLDTLKALMSMLSLFISVDTGPIYIAEAFNIPTIDIVGPVDERVQPPQGFLHRNVVPPGRKKAELTILNSRSYDPDEALRQTLSISDQAVITTTDSLIEDLKGQKML